jgi:hypothetical protein
VSVKGGRTPGRFPANRGRSLLGFIVHPLPRWLAARRNAPILQRNMNESEIFFLIRLFLVVNHFGFGSNRAHLGRGVLVAN